MKKLSLIIATLFFITNFEIYSQTLDTAFSNDGIQTTSVGNGNDFGFSSIIQTDGKIVVSGAKFDGLNYDTIVIRYNTDGTLDTNFATNGIFTLNTETSVTDSNVIALQSNGKIVVASTNKTANSSIRFYIIQLNSNGTLDATFNNTGILTINIESYYQPSVGLLIQNDGKILISGSTYNGGLFSQIFLNRYNINGSIDATFANNGVFTTTFNSNDIVMQAIALQTDGKIIVVGKTGSVFDSSFDGTAIFRLTTTGTFDSLFNNNGSVLFEYVIGSSIALQNDGKIVLAGSVNGFAALRLNNDGSTDNSFGNDGFQSTYINSNTDYCSSLVLQPDGKMILTGTYLIGAVYNIALVRYNIDGSLDNTFNGSGILLSSINTDNDIANKINLQTDGKIVITGSTFNGSNYDIFALRYNNINLSNDLFCKNDLSRAYPNPTENNFSISGFENIEKVEVYDIKGTLIKINKTDFNLTNEASGIYFLKVHSNSHIYNLKIIRK